MKEAAATAVTAGRGSHPADAPLDAPADGGAPGRWLVLVAMTGALSMILIDDTVVSVALPTIQRDLHMTSTELQWIMNAYLLTIGAFIAVAGKVSDLLGRRSVFLAGVVVFVCFSALSGASHWFDSGAMLITARALQGIGAAMMIPSSQAIVTSAFPLAQRGTAMGIYAGVSMAFLAAGPLIGGLLTEGPGWEWVFFVNLPVGVATIVLTFVSHPENARMPRAGRFDALGLLLLVPGLGALVIALMQSTTWGWRSPATLGLLGLGVVLLVVFAVVEPRQDDPLIDLRILRYGNFGTDTLVLFVVQFALMGVSIFGAIFQQDVLGFSPIGAGLALMPLTVPILFVAPPVGRLYDRLGPRPLVTTGAALMALAMGWLAVVALELSYGWLVPGFVVLGVGIAVIMTPANTDAMNSVPGALRGQASGVIQTFRQIGGTVGIAVLSTVILNRSNAQTTDNLEAAGFTADQVAQIEQYVTALQQGDTSSSQVDASQVPASMLSEVRRAFDDGFASGLRAGYLLVAGLLVLATVLAGWRLRRVTFDEAGGVAAP